MNGSTNGESWDAWLRRITEQGLTARWDAETLAKFGVARQTPAQPVGTGAAAQLVPQPGPAPMLSPLVLVGGGLLLLGGLYLAMRD